MSASAETFLVVGLGNPGREYAQTRHNAGFLVVDALARRWGAPESRRRLRSELSEARFEGDRMVLQLPQTYMNDSGIAVREAVTWYKVPLENVLIVVDDVDQPFGQLRMRARGGSGGHNGLKSIFQHLGTEDISRLRIGIGRSKAVTKSHVLSRFNEEERQELPLVLSNAVEAVEMWHDLGVLETMNRINGKTTAQQSAGAPA